MVCQDHLQPGKRKREEEEREDKAKSVRIRRKMEELGISSRLKEDPEDPKSKATNTHKQEPSSIIGVIDSSASDRAFAPTTTSIAPASASAATTSQPAPPISVAFCLHHPSLPSKHPVLITLSPDSTLATSLTNRLVLEFPTIYVLHRQPDGKLPEGFISEEDFFATTKKELIEEMVGGDQAISNMDVAGGGMRGELEDGEVDQRRLLEVFGKDLKEFGGSF